MMEFISAISNPDYGYLRVALAAGLLASVACGIVGSYVVTRRITYIAGSIAHCVLGGMGAARYMQIVHGWTWATPLAGAIATALLAALIIGWVTLRAKEREDTVIGALWAIGMAVGILFIQKTPGSSEDLMSYLFGSIVMVRTVDLWILIALDTIIIATVAALYHPLLAVCFDAEFARLRGLSVETYYLLLLCLTALTVVLLISVVGIVLVIALLTLPVAIAGQFCRTLLSMMLASVAICMFFTVTGLALSYGPDLPAGATTIVLAGGAYLLVLGVKKALPVGDAGRKKPGDREDRRA
ncbi:MAG: metal ABC transporter permease [Phycisphaerae bacterium]|nr:metal ABC transporter permease [Phycisphaerae bacterium]